MKDCSDWGCGPTNPTCAGPSVHVGKWELLEASFNEMSINKLGSAETAAELDPARIGPSFSWSGVETGKGRS